MTYIHLATEDALSEAIGEKMINVFCPSLTLENKFRKNGFGYLRKRIRNFQQLARHSFVVVLTDLDNASCPMALITNWLGDKPAIPSFVFRVAVREVESWLLADHEAMHKLLGKNAKLPPDPDALIDPKATLLRLAASATRRVRAELLPETGAAASQGLGYNDLLGSLVRTDWDPRRGAERSPSLARACKALNRLLS